jgi:hypothetical protein
VRGDVLAYPGGTVQIGDRRALAEIDDVGAAAE